MTALLPLSSLQEPSNADHSQGKDDEHDVQYFRKIVTQTVDKLTKLSEEWENISRTTEKLTEERKWHPVVLNWSQVVALKNTGWFLVEQTKTWN